MKRTLEVAVNVSWSVEKTEAQAIPGASVQMEESQAEAEWSLEMDDSQPEPEASLEMEVMEKTEAFPSAALRSLGGSSDDDKVARQRREAQADAEWQAADVPDAAETLKKMDDEDREGNALWQVLARAESKKEAAYAEWQAVMERVGELRKAESERVEESMAAEAAARQAAVWAAWELKQDQKRGRIYPGRGGWKAKIAAEGMKIGSPRRSKPKQKI